MNAIFPLEPFVEFNIRIGDYASNYIHNSEVWSTIDINITWIMIWRKNKRSNPSCQKVYSVYFISFLINKFILTISHWLQKWTYPRYERPSLTIKKFYFLVSFLMYIHRQNNLKFVRLVFNKWLNCFILCHLSLKFYISS